MREEEAEGGGDDVPEVEDWRNPRKARARSNTDLLIAAKLGEQQQEDDEDGEDSFRERLWSAWSKVALENGTDSLGCDEIRNVFQAFGYDDTGIYG